MAGLARAAFPWALAALRAVGVVKSIVGQHGTVRCPGAAGVGARSVTQNPHPGTARPPRRPSVFLNPPSKKLQRLLFVALLYLMAAASFVVFAATVVPWVQFRYSSQPAVLALRDDALADPAHDNPKALAQQRARGHPVWLTLPTGEKLALHARLKTELLNHAAAAPQGVPVLYRRDGPGQVQVIRGHDELDSPWVWLVLGLVFAPLAGHASRLRARERG